MRLHSRFRSPHLATLRDIAVYVPPDYDEGRDRYPVLYMQDGQNLFNPETAFGGRDWQADLTADELTRAGQIEPLIIVGVYNTGPRRINEYTPTRDRRRRAGGAGERYAGLLARDLKPFIDRHYRTRRSAANSGAGGSSLGGLVSLQAGLLFPRVFGKLAILSPSIWWDNRAILETVRSYRSNAHARIWLDCGTAESERPEEILEDVRTLRSALASKGWREGTDLRYFEVPEAGHNEAAWGARFGCVLRFLFPARDARQAA